ncbi:unnamed protein product [marine sediment metagenome]|uniref:Uncharacterized protein n=1 Tax=marine sediment metagenome TaxID=412755 RepID=X0YAK5_9ZZZZ
MSLSIGVNKSLSEKVFSDSDACSWMPDAGCSGIEDEDDDEDDWRMIPGAEPFSDGVNLKRRARREETADSGYVIHLRRDIPMIHMSISIA